MAITPEKYSVFCVSCTHKQTKSQFDNVAHIHTIWNPMVLKSLVQNKQFIFKQWSTADEQTSGS
jgi:hypothetical protein